MLGSEKLEEESLQRTVEFLQYPSLARIHANIKFAVCLVLYTHASMNFLSQSYVVSTEITSCPKAEVKICD